MIEPLNCMNNEGDKTPYEAPRFREIPEDDYKSLLINAMKRAAELAVDMWTKLFVELLDENPPPPENTQDFIMEKDVV